MSYRRKLEEKKRLKRLYNKTHEDNIIETPAKRKIRKIRYCGAYYDQNKKRLIRYYKSDYSAYKFFKKCFHKKIRHSETVSNKEYDLRWKTF